MIPDNIHLGDSLKIFRAYDIRGKYPSELDEELAYKVGKAYVKLLKCKKVVIGRDMRLSSNSIFDALAKGITDSGCDVVDIGMSTTPMLYHASRIYEGGIMITASHNPGKYNGIKLCREKSIPIGKDNGLEKIRKYVEKGKFKDINKKGKITKKDFFKTYVSSLRRFSKGIKDIRVVVDTGNGMAGLVVPDLFKEIDVKLFPLFFKIDGSFPNHQPNPLLSKNLRSLKKKVKEKKADIGIAFDGDADRVIFVDEKAREVPADLITGLIAREILKKKKGTILYDLRSTNAVREIIEENNGKAKMCRVGHAFIKRQMRKQNALFAGELSGHYYFKEANFTDNAVIAMFYVLKLMSSSKSRLSELVDSLRRYHDSGEINFKVDDKDKIIAKIEKKYSSCSKVTYLDGVRFDFKDWWFNLRKSNTEPYLRLNIEANSKKLLLEKKKEISEIITQNF